MIDPGHPYIKHINTGGNWLLGGEVELLGRIRYNDGLDQYRLTAKELVDEFVRRGADAVFAFQTRNPTHAGHAYLMRTAREKLLKKGKIDVTTMPTPFRYRTFERAIDCSSGVYLFYVGWVQVTRTLFCGCRLWVVGPSPMMCLSMSGSSSM